MFDESKKVNVSLLNVNDSCKGIPAVLVSADAKVGPSGKSYLTMEFLDGFSRFEAKWFGNDMSTLDSKCVTVGDVVDIDITVQPFNNGKSLRIDDLRATVTGAQAKDFALSAPIDTEVAFKQILDVLGTLTEQEKQAHPDSKYSPITELAREMLIENKDDYVFSGAAKKMHHATIGGLIYHSFRMLQTACALCKVYTSLDRALLCSAVALHDLAKIREMDTSLLGTVEYTIPGKLMGHLYLGSEMIHDYVLAHPDTYDPEKVMLLKHMILSHHLNPEWGAVVSPSTAEAQMLHYIDQIDAKMYMFENHFTDLKPGEITDKVPFGLENNVYKPL